MRPIKKGSTDQSTIIRIIDSSDGTPEPGVEHDTSGIDLWYRREGATKTSITEAALASLDAAHSDGGIEHIDDGYYRLDLPDAAVASGADGVMVGGGVTGMIVIGCYIPLVDYDPYDGVRMGMTALPNAAADAAGGLPISDAGGLDLDAQIGTDIDAILVDTNELQTDDVPSLISALNDPTAASIADAVWDEAASGHVGAGTFGQQCGTDIDAILADTNELQSDNIPGTLATIDGKIDTIDGIVDSVLEDTGTTIPGTISTMQGNVTDILADTDELQSDNIPGTLTTMDGKIDTIDTVVDGIQTDLSNGTDGLGALKTLIDGLNDISAADVWDATSATLSLSFEALMDRVYQMTSNKMTVNESSGAVALRNVADNANIATGSVTSSSGTTTRAGLSWV